MHIDPYICMPTERGNPLQSLFCETAYQLPGCGLNRPRARRSFLALPPCRAVPLHGTLGLRQHHTTYHAHLPRKISHHMRVICWHISHANITREILQCLGCSEFLLQARARPPLHCKARKLANRRGLYRTKHWHRPRPRKLPTEAVIAGREDYMRVFGNEICLPDV
jgi:hypothetical protein